MERSIFALTHILVEALPDIRWTRLMALRTGNFMARKILSNAQAIAEQSEFEGLSAAAQREKILCTIIIRLISPISAMPIKTGHGLK